MSSNVRQIDYFYTQVTDAPGSAYEILQLLAGSGVNLLGFHGMPMGPERTQLTLFPEDKGKLQHVAQGAGMVLDGPHPAIVIQGDDEMGVLARIHKKLAAADVNVFASVGLADGRGDFCYVVYLREEKVQDAVRALGI